MEERREVHRLSSYENKNCPVNKHLLYTRQVIMIKKPAFIGNEKPFFFHSHSLSTVNKRSNLHRIISIRTFPRIQLDPISRLLEI